MNGRDDWSGEESASEEDTPRIPDAEIARELRLRPESPRVTRVSRKALAVAGGAVAVGLGAVFILALEPRQRDAVVKELYTTGRATPAEGVAALPRDYTAIPKLGPPLPGEFGKPVLRHARETGQPIPDEPGMSAVGSPPGGGPATASKPVDPVMQTRRQERAAARTSGLFFGRASAAAGPTGPDVARAAAAPTEAAISAGEPVTTAQRRASFVSFADRASPGPAAINHVLRAGSTIPAALVTGIRSDLPGLVVAQVTEPVRDSATGTTILIPQGTRLIGLYDSDLTAGQSRLLLAWTRLTLPDGRAIDLDRMPAADAAGQTGLQDRVDHHWGGMLRAALVSTVLGVGAQSSSSGDETDIARALRDGASDSVARTGRQIVERDLGRPPTLTIRPGYPVRVMVIRDLIIEPAR